MTGGKPIFEQLLQINLAAGGGQGQKIKVMDMNISALMGLGMLWVDDIHFVELLGAF